MNALSQAKPKPENWWGSVGSLLPQDGYTGSLVGRLWDPRVDGPSVVGVRKDGVFDLSGSFATMRDLCEEADPARALAMTRGKWVGDLAGLLDNTAAEHREDTTPWLLPPIDLQTIKAAGVTFVASMIERVIEERVRGDAEAAQSMRAQILEDIGTDLRNVKPGSPSASRVKEFLVGKGLWSQYLEVGIGPDAEIFTKAPTLSAVGTASEAGVLTSSAWNNPEPEVVLAVNSTGTIVGATLGNDINLRDVEGRSALLLPKAKDNNASCSVGPLLRFFDTTFGLGDLRNTAVSLEVEGADGVDFQASSLMSEISRDPVELVAQLIGAHHQYPDGAVLFLGTMFAPVADRETAGSGFTHKFGDIVRISAPELGTLVNRIQASERCEPWTFGISSLMTNLAKRGLLGQ